MKVDHASRITAIVDQANARLMRELAEPFVKAFESDLAAIDPRGRDAAAKVGKAGALLLRKANESMKSVRPLTESAYHDELRSKTVTQFMDTLAETLFVRAMNHRDKRGRKKR